MQGVKFEIITHNFQPSLSGLCIVPQVLCPLLALLVPTLLCAVPLLQTPHPPTHPPSHLQRLGCNAELVVDEFGEKLLEELDYMQVCVCGVWWWCLGLDRLIRMR